jgi:LysR family glycine cleavage system transcriptional activator
VSDLPSLNAVRMFEAAARAQSFTQAGEELHVTQGAVSRQVAVLEDQLGCKLFDRNGPRLKLSHMGRQYQQVVVEALEIIRQGTARIRRENQANTLTVSILPSFASYWLIPRISILEQALPHISLHLATSYRSVDFDRDSEIDLAIRLGRGDWLGVYKKQITRDQLFPVCAPAVAEQIDQVEDLHKQRLITEIPKYDEWTSWFEKVGVQRRSKEDLTYDDTGIQIRAAIGGQGIMLAREEFVRDYLRTGSLVRLFDQAIVSEFQYYFVCPQARVANPDIQKFHDWLLAAN